MKVYLGDLGHYTIKLTNNCTPLNIGFIAAYAQKNVAADLEFQLFRDPKRLVQAIQKDPQGIQVLSKSFKHTE